VPWPEFAEQYPSAPVLSQETGYFRDYGRSPHPGYDAPTERPRHFHDSLDRRLPPLERVLAVDFGAESVAFPFSLLQSRRVVEHERSGRDVVLFWTPGLASMLDREDVATGRDVGAAAAFQRPAVKGQLLSFAADRSNPTRFTDAETRSVWNIFGLAIAGPLAGKALPSVPYEQSFWFACAAARPDTVVVSR
ncbi:MAG: DUF3179 domain-containing (seleno)protein, partial [Dehalococcoidia bacterium]